MLVASQRCARRPAVMTISRRLTEAEAAELRAYLDVSGEVEAVALKKAALRGIRELRLGEAILLYLDERDTERAARVAGLPRAQFLNVLAEKGFSVLDAPSTLTFQLDRLARRFANP